MRDEGDKGRALPDYLQHLLLAGPVTGFLASVYQYLIWRSATDHRIAATGHVVRRARIWHGKVIDHYYITLTQARFEEWLAFPVACWMVLVLGGLVLSGIWLDTARPKTRSTLRPRTGGR